jgi:hypothetical protein
LEANETGNKKQEGKKEEKGRRKRKEEEEEEEEKKTNEVAVSFLTCTGLNRREHDALRLEKRDGFFAFGEDLELQRPNPRAQLQGLE